jgi:amidase
VQADIDEAEELIGRKSTTKDFEPATRAFGLIGKATTAGESAKCLRYLHLCTRQIGKFFEGYDLLLTPTLALPPVKIGELQPKPAEVVLMNLLCKVNAAWVLRVIRAADVSTSKIWAFMPYTPVFNVTGQPAMSVPLHWNAEGLPIGMHFVARYGDEATLLRLAGQLEQARPWSERVAPVGADV